MNSNLILFYDGCHKIYYAERTDEATIGQMKGYGYDVIDGNFGASLKELWRKSCSLRFVEPANLDFSHPHISQFQAGGLRGFRTILRDYFEGAA